MNYLKDPIEYYFVTSVSGIAARSIGKKTRNSHVCAGNAHSHNHTSKREGRKPRLQKLLLLLLLLLLIGKLKIFFFLYSHYRGSFETLKKMKTGQKMFKKRF